MLIAYADGIGTARLTEDDGRSILQHVVRPLAAKTGARPVRIEWPASMAGIGGHTSWAAAAHAGVLHLDQLLADHPGERVILLGYSGGCRVVHDWLHSRPAQRHRIAAVGLMSDPYRPFGRSQHGTKQLDGWGVCGQRLGPLPGKTLWTSVARDVISDASSDSPWRTVADLSDQIPGGFMTDLVGHLKQGDWQLATKMGLWRRDPLAYLRGLGPRMDRARRDGEGYLTGLHTTAYTRPHHTPDGKTDSLAHRLAASLAWMVNPR